MVVASTDLVVTVPASIGKLFRQIADLQVLQPPFPIPFIDVKQYWHRYQQFDPGNRWLRSVVVDLFSECSLPTETSANDRFGIDTLTSDLA
jgi:hypothetical protein